MWITVCLTLHTDLMGIQHNVWIALLSPGLFSTERWEGHISQSQIAGQKEYYNCWRGLWLVIVSALIHCCMLDFHWMAYYNERHTSQSFSRPRAEKETADKNRQPIWAQEMIAFQQEWPHVRSQRWARKVYSSVQITCFRDMSPCPENLIRGRKSRRHIRCKKLNKITTLNAVIWKCITFSLPLFGFLSLS